MFVKNLFLLNLYYHLSLFILHTSNQQAFNVPFTKKPKSEERARITPRFVHLIIDYPLPQTPINLILSVSPVSFTESQTLKIANLLLFARFTVTMKMALLYKPTICFPHKFCLDPPKSIPRSSITMKDSINNTNLNTIVDSSAAMEERKLPILLFDVMDTLVRDPFYHDIPDFFGYLSFPLFFSFFPSIFIWDVFMFLG